MKAEIINKQEFKPVVVTIETQEEWDVFYACFNHSSAVTRAVEGTPTLKDMSTNEIEQALFKFHKVISRCKQTSSYGCM